MLSFSALAASSRILASGLSFGSRNLIVPSVSIAKQPPNFSILDTMSRARFTASPPKKLVPRNHRYSQHRLQYREQEYRQCLRGYQAISPFLVPLFPVYMGNNKTRIGIYTDFLVCRLPHDQF